MTGRPNGKNKVPSHINPRFPRVNRGGVPLKIDDHDLAQIEELSGYGLTLEQISRAMGWGRCTVGKKLAARQDVREAVERGRDRAIANVSAQAFDMAVSGKYPIFTMFWLKCRAGWNDRQHEVVDDRPIIFETRITSTGALKNTQRFAALTDAGEVVELGDDDITDLPEIPPVDTSPRDEEDWSD